MITLAVLFILFAFTIGYLLGREDGSSREHEWMKAAIKEVKDAKSDD